MLSIGRKIQEYRVKNGFSQETLAEKMNVSRQSVSKWELGQTLPEVDKIISMSKLFSVSADNLLAINEKLSDKPNKNQLKFGMYLVVKDFKKAYDFYEAFLSIKGLIISPDMFAQFFINDICFSIMNEAKLQGHDYSGINSSAAVGGDHKFVLNFWINDLQAEYERVKGLNIGAVTEIIQKHTNYYFFNLYDPDNNVIEITGNYNNLME